MSAVLARRGPALGRTLVDAEFLRDPYPTYHALREAGPVHWSDEFFGGAWLLTRHADVEAVLRDTRFSAQRTGGWVMQDDEARRELKEFQRLFARAMLFLDAPDHQRIRRVLNAAFRPATLQQLVPDIECMADELLDSIDAESGFDFMRSVARLLPARVIARMMGIENEDHARFAAWSEDLAVFIGAVQPSREQARCAQASLLAMTDYFQALLARRDASNDDVVGRLVQAEAHGQIHPGAELLAQCAMLLFAGYETTRNLLGNGLQALLTHRAQWQRLKAEPVLLPDAVRELLRFDSPVQYTGRRVTADTALHGQVLRRGDLVVALIGAANRDPARHAQPDVLDIIRGTGSLSFGSGPHVCIGSALTLIEAQAVFGGLLRRWPDLELSDARPAWNGNPVYRGLTRLPVRAATS
jgi:cytochrome P450